MRIGIIGCGHMGSAIAKALLEKNHTVWVSNRSGVHIKFKPAQKKYFHWTADNTEVVKKTDVVFLGVKPGNVEAILHEVKNNLTPEKILVSIAAGITLKKLSIWSGSHKKIVRVMPNLPAQIFEGISVWKASSGLYARGKKIIVKLFKAFGKEIEVQNEDLINVAIGGSGPAYTAAFLESMARSAKKAGFTKEQARVLAIQTVLGSVLYMEKSGADFTNLVKTVQTKGGITEASFKILKAEKWQEIFEKALHAANRRAREIGKHS